MTLNLLPNGHGLISDTVDPFARRADELPVELTDKRHLLKLLAIALRNGRQIMIASSLLAKLEEREIQKFLER